MRMLSTKSIGYALDTYKSYLDDMDSSAWNGAQVLSDREGLERAYKELEVINAYISSE